MKRYLALTLITLAAAGCDAMTAHTGVVARVGEHELTVEEAADLVAGNPQIPPRSEVIRSLADLWIDYTVMASMAAQDSSFQQLDVESLMRPYVQQQTFSQLREQVITADTAIGAEELEELYAQQAPGLRVRASHVLLTFPEEASDAERDSVRALAEEIRERALAGEDFSELARTYSDDQGTAQQGGDLGWFGTGQMVQPFEEAAFELEPGEVSEVVETPFGLHVIKVVDREMPDFDEVRNDFRATVIEDRRQASLDAYVESVRADRSFEIREGAPDVARDLADNPSTPLRGRAASRALVTWDDGELTAQELVGLFRGMPQQQRSQYATMSNQQMEQLLEDVATNELILADAGERGIAVPEEEQDSVRGLIRDQVAGMAQQVGLVGPAQEDETQAEAVDRRVMSYLRSVLSGEAQLLPLGALSHTLREDRDWQIYDGGVREVTERMTEGQTGTGPGAGAPTPPTGQQPVPEMPDTAG